MPCAACGIMQPVQSRAPAQATPERLDNAAFGFEHLKSGNRVCRDGPHGIDDGQRKHQYLQSKFPADTQEMPDRELSPSLRVFSMSHLRPLPDLRTGKDLRDAALDRGVSLRVGPADQPAFVPGGNARMIPRHSDLLIRRDFAPASCNDLRTRTGCPLWPDPEMAASAVHWQLRERFQHPADAVWPYGLD